MIFLTGLQIMLYDILNGLTSDIFNGLTSDIFNGLTSYAL